MSTFRKTIAAAAILAGLAASTALPALAEANFGQVVSSIQTMRKSVAEVPKWTDVASVTVVKIADLKDNDPAALTNATTKNKEDIAELRKALMANPKVAEALGTAAVDINSVVAAEMGADKVLTVYVS
jgi:hypothetical protein